MMAVLAKIIVDGTMNGGEFLWRLYVPESRHYAFSSSDRLVRVFGPIVEPTADHLTRRAADLFHSHAI